MESTNSEIAEKLLYVEELLYGRIINREKKLTAAKLAVWLFEDGWRCENKSFYRVNHRGKREEKELLDQDIEKAARKQGLRGRADTDQEKLVQNVRRFLQVVTTLGRPKGFKLTHLQRNPE